MDDRLANFDPLNETIKSNYKLIYSDPETIENIRIFIPKD